jgi:F420-0:gamma-glutamyl ligase-like protein
MANLYTALASAQNDTTNVKNRAEGKDLTGNVVYAKGTYTTTASDAAADVLYLALLPKGAVVVPSLCRIDTEDLGTDISVTVGDLDSTADADRYSTAVSLATAGAKDFASGVAGANPHALASEAWITATLVDAGSISITADKDVTFWIAYRMP